MRDDGKGWGGGFGQDEQDGQDEEEPEMATLRF
jgi:hypothetical protein